MTQHETKTYRAEIKAVGGTKADPSGAFEALVSVFDNVDLGGDRVLPGAFTETLNKWAAKGDPIPVIWSHEWDDPESHIGVVTNAQETPDGLLVQAQLDVANNERAKYVARLLAERRVTQFSFGYYAKEWDVVEDPEYGPVRELKVVDLFEVGPTLLGMNPATQLVQAASALTRSGKAGRVLSSTNEQLIRAAYTALEEVLAGLGSPEEPRTDPQQSGKSADADTAGEVTADAAETTTSDETANAEETTTTETPEADTASGDTTSTIDPERLAELLILSEH